MTRGGVGNLLAHLDIPHEAHRICWGRIKLCSPPRWERLLFAELLIKAGQAFVHSGRDRSGVFIWSVLSQTEEILQNLGLFKTETTEIFKGHILFFFWQPVEEDNGGGDEADCEDEKEESCSKKKENMNYIGKNCLNDWNVFGYSNCNCLYCIETKRGDYKFTVVAT